MDSDHFKRKAETWAQRARDVADITVRAEYERLAGYYADLAWRLTDTGALQRQEPRRR